MADPLSGIKLEDLKSYFDGGSSQQNDPLKGINIDDLKAHIAAVPEVLIKPKSEEFWQGLNNDPSWSALGKRIGIGVLRGGKNVLDTGAHALAKGTSYLADKILPEELALPIRQSTEQTISTDKSARDQFDSEYKDSVAVDIGRVGGQIAATLPIMPAKAFQAIAAGAKALPTMLATGEKIAAPLANRLVSAAGQGALGGAVLNTATSSTNDKSLAENVGEGVVTGGIGGPLLTGIAAGGKALGSKIVGRISQTRAELAKRADELGISLKATQVSSSPLLKKYDQVSGMLPFSGAQGVTDTQLGQFTRAISRTFGKDVGEITPKIIADARKEIGQGMENIYKTSTVKADSQLAIDLKRVFDEAATNYQSPEIKPVVNNIREITKKINSYGEIDGETYHALTKYDAVLSKAQKSSNPNIRNSANQIRVALEGALDRSLASGAKEALSKLRGQYKAAMTVKDLVDASADGYVSPLKLMHKVTKSPGGKLRSGELGEIADIGRAFFPTPADSGTPLGETMLNGLGSLLHNPLPVASAAGGALYSGAALLDVAAGAAGLGVNRAMREAVNSKFTKNAIIRSGTGETHGLTNKLVEKAVPYTSLPIRKDNDHPLRITINPKY